ncbi:MAG: ankyrin repeat domain-containing protein [Gammaproteobacteria bacterium]|nr:ankyrin repeat domain-containing protein [Gammaproteobacteria bacterium]
MHTNRNIPERNINISLHEAVKDGDDKKFAELINSPRVSINLILDGCTALHHAAFYGRVKIVSILLEKGAAIDKKSESGETAITLAANNGYSDIVIALLKVGSKEDKNQLLINAVRNDNADIISALSDYGVYVDKKTKNPEEPTALFTATQWEKPKVLATLIKLGANINFVNDYGETPLFIAVKKNYSKIIKILLEAGADVSIKNIKGQTAAMFCENKEILDLLKNYEINSVNIEKQLSFIQEEIKKSTISSEEKQRYFNLLMKNMTHSLQIIHDNALQADHLNNQELGSLLFEFANLISVANQNNNPLLDKACLNNRLAARELDCKSAENIDKFNTEKFKDASFASSSVTHFKPPIKPLPIEASKDTLTNKQIKKFN